MTEIAHIKVVWITVLKLATANPSIQIIWHCYDANGEQIAGYGGRWYCEYAQMSVARKALVTAWLADLRVKAIWLVRNTDVNAMPESTVTIHSVDMARYTDTSVGVSVIKDYGEGEEFSGQLLYAQGENGGMLMNHRIPVVTEIAAQIVTQVNAWLTLAEQIVWKLRVDRI